MSNDILLADGQTLLQKLPINIEEVSLSSSLMFEILIKIERGVFDWHTVKAITHLNKILYPYKKNSGKIILDKLILQNIIDGFVNTY